MLVACRRRDVFGEFIKPKPAPHLGADQIANGIGDLLAPAIGQRDGQSHRVVVSRCILCFADYRHRGRWEETSSHLSPNAPRASRCSDGHMADRRRSSLKIPEPPTLRACPLAM